MTPDDRELIEAAKRDPSAFASLYGKYVRPIYRYLWSRVGRSREVAEDLAQETFTRAFVALPRFTARYANSYYGYLKKIAGNLVISRYRKKEPISLPPEELPEIATDPRPHLEHTIEAKKLWKKVEGLNENERQVLRLFYESDMKIATIAREMSRTTNATKLLLARARRKLRTKAEEVTPRTK